MRKHVHQNLSTTTAEAVGSAEGDVSEASSSSVVRTVSNPAFESWVVVDQLILSWLYNSMTVEVAKQVMGHNNAKDLWMLILELFGVQSRAGEDYFETGIPTNSRKMTDYIRVVKHHANNLVLAGSSAKLRSLISHILLGLDEEYNPIVATLQGKTTLTWAELQSELLTFEKRLDFQ